MASWLVICATIRPLLRLLTECHGVQPGFSDPFLSLVAGTLDKLSGHHTLSK
ncbi:hypothetical protein LMG3328_03236 [Achromobacter ruhlandii]|uniref:Uncharacterized protein n=1 Tax=Achromobacter ruhlandii TaxID=72557 RepID=A0A6S7DRI3_9BURK|nr:hypothetical protein LMG3328_03236 [Achromobacter ruhlandii]